MRTLLTFLLVASLSASSPLAAQETGETAATSAPDSATSNSHKPANRRYVAKKTLRWHAPVQASHQNNGAGPNANNVEQAQYDMSPAPSGVQPEIIETPGESSMPIYEEGHSPIYESEDGYPVDNEWAGPNSRMRQVSGPGCSEDFGRPWHRWNNFWVSADYLNWWTDGMYVPVLATTSPAGTAAADAGVLGRSDTEILFGGQDYYDGSRPGYRFRAGWSLDDCGLWGFEAEYFSLVTNTVRNSYDCDSIDSEILARPFFNLAPTAPPAREDSQVICYPGQADGYLRIEYESELHSTGFRLRRNICGDGCCSSCGPYGGGCDSCDGGGCGSCQPPCRPWRFDMLFGYRYLRLNESLVIDERLETGIDQFDLRDDFRTNTEFHGFEIGCLYEVNHCYWSLELLSKVAIGNSHQEVTVNGSTVQTTGGDSDYYQGGFLAQRSNIGTSVADELAVVPELGVTLGYQITPRMRATFGYTFLYWSSVVRPGDQIDLDVNPDLLPPIVGPVNTAERPRSFHRESNYWAQGINVGLEYRL